MQTLKKFIFESKIEDIRKRIIDSINLINDEKILKNIENNLSFDDKKNDELIKYLKDNCKITNYNTIIQKLKYHNVLSYFYELINPIKNNDKNDNFVTTDKLIKSNNIYDLIYKYVDSINSELSKDEDFISCIKDLANFDMKEKVTIGKMEILSRIFLQDFDNNAKSGDIISTNGNRFEYKISGGRIMGNNEEHKPLSSKVITDEFKKLLTNLLLDKYNINKNELDSTISGSSSLIRNNSNDKELDKALKDAEIINYINDLNNKENIFRKNNYIKDICKVFDFNKVTANDINEIIVKSILAQLPKLPKFKNEDIIDIINKYPIVDSDKKILVETGIKNFKRIFLILHLLNYYIADNWNYLILFDDSLNGAYNIISAPKDNTFKSMDESVEDKAESKSLPCYGSGTNIQNQAPKITYIKQEKS